MPPRPPCPSPPPHRLRRTKEHSENLLFDPAAIRALEQEAKRLGIRVPRRAIEEARWFGGWTVNKLDLLEWYLRMYPRVAGGGSYIDGFAGTGTINVTGQANPRPGSVQVALRSKAFKHHYFYELPQNAKLLQEWLMGLGPTKRLKCTVTAGDFNETVLEHLDAGRIPRDKPCLAFLDPNSTELSWSTLERLAAYKGGGGGGKVLKVELFVLFNTHQALMRLMPTEYNPGYPESGAAAALDRVMGGRDAWWDLYERNPKPGALAQRYAQRMEDVLGYRSARTYRIMDSATSRPQYYMIQASDHHAAFSFMHWAERTSGAARDGKRDLWS